MAKQRGPVTAPATTLGGREDKAVWLTFNQSSLLDPWLTGSGFALANAWSRFVPMPRGASFDYTFP